MVVSEAQTLEHAFAVSVKAVVTFVVGLRVDPSRELARDCFLMYPFTGSPCAPCEIDRALVVK